MGHSIAAVSDRPELAPVVAAWLVGAFPRDLDGLTAEAMATLILAPPVGPEETFVLFDGDEPAATASLARKDLEARPDLTPWLAGIFVRPGFRGRGHATALVRRVEAFARAASVPVLWLYTVGAEPLYARLGWQRVGTERNKGQEVALMRRLLTDERQGAGSPP